MGSFLNTFGGVCFLVAASSGFFATWKDGGLDYDQNNWLVNFPYLIGSLAFWFGSYFSLWMWKNEQYGLGLISEINLGERTVEPETEGKFVLNMHSQYGCGRSS